MVSGPTTSDKEKKKTTTTKKRTDGDRLQLNTVFVDLLIQRRLPRHLNPHVHRDKSKNNAPNEAEDDANGQSTRIRQRATAATGRLLVVESEQNRVGAIRLTRGGQILDGGDIGTGAIGAIVVQTILVDHLKRRIIGAVVVRVARVNVAGLISGQALTRASASDVDAAKSNRPSSSVEVKQSALICVTQ